MRAEVNTAPIFGKKFAPAPHSAAEQFGAITGHSLVVSEYSYNKDEEIFGEQGPAEYVYQVGYEVGFGGSMVWFGSSAGVALSNMYPEAKSVGLWLRYGWTVPIAYVVGFFALLLMIGWHPDAAPGQSSP